MTASTSPPRTEFGHETAQILEGVIAEHRPSLRLRSVYHFRMRGQQSNSMAAIPGTPSDGCPVRPVKTLVMQRTRSIGTSVLPAVMRMFIIVPSDAEEKPAPVHPQTNQPHHQQHRRRLHDWPEGVVEPDRIDGWTEQRQARQGQGAEMDL